MRFLLEFKSFSYKKDDIVLIEYWYNDMVTPVKIIEKQKRGYKITHNIPESKIFNAPDEIIKSSDIIDYFS
jgi:hypothetical protein